MNDSFFLPRERARKMMQSFPGDSLRDFGAKLDMLFDGRSRQEWEALAKDLRQVHNETTFTFAHRCKNLFEFLAIDDGGKGMTDDQVLTTFWFSFFVSLYILQDNTFFRCVLASLYEGLSVRPSVCPSAFKQNRRKRRFQPARRILLPAGACFVEV